MGVRVATAGRWEENQERGVLDAGRKCFREECRVGVSQATDGQAGCGLRMGRWGDGGAHQDRSGWCELEGGQKPEQRSFTEWKGRNRRH